MAQRRSGYGDDLDLVPVRETGMTAYEIMLSESQERMLMVIDPEQAETARAIFDKWDLDFMPIGKVTDTERLILFKDGELACDIPLAPLVDDAPEYDRPYRPNELQPVLATSALQRDISLKDALLQMMGSADLASRRWIYEQYDCDVMADTLIGPGGDAALVRVHGTDKALAVTTDCTPRYVDADPFEGGTQAVAEAWRNICATGAIPLAVTNNLNFGNPEKQDIMAQIVGSVNGMGKACKVLNTPVVSGNVSLYNETDGEAIQPCPVIGMVGLIDNWKQAVGAGFTAPDKAIFVIGQTAEMTDGWLGNSVFARVIAEREGGAPPPVDLDKEKAHGQFVQAQITSGHITTCHDIGDGGLLVAVAEMALSGAVGAALSHPDGDTVLAWAFGEDQARYIVQVDDAEAFAALLAEQAIDGCQIGTTSAHQTLTVGQNVTISIEELRTRHEGKLPQMMA